MTTATPTAQFLFRARMTATEPEQAFSPEETVPFPDPNFITIENEAGAREWARTLSGDGTGDDDPFYIALYDAGQAYPIGVYAAGRELGDEEAQAVLLTPHSEQNPADVDHTHCPEDWHSRRPEDEPSLDVDADGLIKCVSCGVGVFSCMATTEVHHVTALEPTPTGDDAPHDPEVCGTLVEQVSDRITALLNGPHEGYVEHLGGNCGSLLPTVRVQPETDGEGYEVLYIVMEDGRSVRVEVHPHNV